MSTLCTTTANNSPPYITTTSCLSSLSYAETSQIDVNSSNFTEVSNFDSSSPLLSDSSDSSSESSSSIYSSKSIDVDVSNGPLENESWIDSPEINLSNSSTSTMTPSPTSIQPAVADNYVSPVITRSSTVSTYTSSIIESYLNTSLVSPGSVSSLPNMRVSPIYTPPTTTSYVLTTGCIPSGVSPTAPSIAPSTTTSYMLAPGCITSPAVSDDTSTPSRQLFDSIYIPSSDGLSTVPESFHQSSNSGDADNLVPIWNK